MPVRLTKEEVQNRLDKNFEQKVTLIGDYINKNTPIRLRCEECGHEWSTTPGTVIYDDYKHKCPNCGFKSGKWVKCAYCGKQVYRTLGQIERNESGYYYCSRACGNRHKNLLKIENDEDGKLKNYRRKAFDKYEHKCAVCGWDEDIRLLEVHHRDENHENNKIENLCILCPTCHRKITLHYYVLTDDNKLVENN